ncbi:VanW family protein [Propionibacteriaceae bacterium Y1700]|uniref:VanW family protein n=1 Tax=Microlunatus sp. Y1700 TaxID=3418487 RepID=UPI003DA6FF1B
MSSTTRPDTSARGRAGKIVGLVLGGLALVVVGFYAVGYFAASDKLPRDAAIAGIPIGGLTRDQAIDKVETELGPKATGTITVTVDGKDHEIDPAAAGLGVDIPATVDEAGAGRSADPRHIVRILTGGEDRAPKVIEDRAKLEGEVAKIAEKSDRKGTDATIKIDKGKVKTTKSEQAHTLDRQATADRVRGAYLNTDVVEVSTAKQDAEISDADIAEAKAYAEKAVSGPVKVKVENEGEFTAGPQTIGKSITFAVENEKVVAKADPKKLAEGIKADIESVDIDKPVDARVEISGGKPKVIPAKDGWQIDSGVAVKAVTDTLTKSGKDRTVEIKAKRVKAKHTTDQAKKSGVKEVVSSFTSAFPHAAGSNYRTINLTVAARLMNNTYLAPGETFSLNGQIGPRSKSQGFVDGSFIEGGVLKQGLAGGISQSATTVYNAAFFSGLEIVEHQPHTLYFDRYPAGRESTVYYPSIDVKFKNNSPYGVVLTASVDPSSPGKKGAITVKLWSTKHFEVETADPVKSNFYSGTTRYSDDPKCVPQAPIKGFTAKYYRIIKVNGKQVKREDYTWRYSAGDDIRCR